MSSFLITGAGRGIGAALARRLASDGTLLALVDRGPKRDLDNIAEHCRDSGATVATDTFDVSDETRIANFIADAADQHGGLDLVFANAGIIHAAGDDVHSTKSARELMETNYFGAINTLAPAAHIMSQQGYGGLVAITSISALVATHGSASYSASKAALMMWTDSLRLKLRDTNVSVTNIVLGFVDTPMNDGFAHAERLMIDADVAADEIVRAGRGGVAIASVPSLRNSPWWLLRDSPHSLRSAVLARAYRHFS